LARRIRNQLSAKIDIKIKRRYVIPSLVPGTSAKMHLNMRESVEDCAKENEGRKEREKKRKNVGK